MDFLIWGIRQNPAYYLGIFPHLDLYEKGNGAWKIIYIASFSLFYCLKASICPDHINLQCDVRSDSDPFTLILLNTLQCHLTNL